MTQIVQNPSPGNGDKFWSKMLSSINHDTKIKSNVKFAPFMADQNMITTRAANLRPGLVKKNGFWDHHTKVDHLYMGKNGLSEKKAFKIPQKANSPARNFKSTNLLVTGTLAPENTQKLIKKS